MNRKSIFDVVRKLIGRGFTPEEVVALDRAIDEALATRAEDGDGEPAPVPAPSPPAPLGRAVGANGIALIKSFEGCAKKRPDGMIEAYPDPGTDGDPWTIGWGATHKHGRKVKQGDIITQDEADALLAQHLVSYAAEVEKALDGAPTSQEQFDALLSFHYNTGAIRRATLTKRHRAGDFEDAAREFGKWVRAGGRVMRGLARRRAAEEALYRQGC